MSNACEVVKWNKITRKVWSKETNRMVEMPLFCLNLIQDYKIVMNAIDLADQIINTYCWDLFMRKMKWWWSIMMWCLHMLLANLYIFYKKYMKMHDLNPISHFDFNQQVCMAWIDTDNHWPKKKRTYQARYSSVASTTRSTLSSSDFMKMAPRFTDKSLHPITGSLCRRLEESKPHWPIPTANLSAICQLHRWALGGKKKKLASLIDCSYRKVTLCAE